MMFTPTALLRLAPALALAGLFTAASARAQTDRIGCLWDKRADSPIARFEAGTIPIDGQLYCFGGFFNQAIQASPRVDAYDPVSNAWTRRADMPANTTHCGFVLEGRNVWVIAGFEGNNPGVAVDDVWIYNIDANTWSAGPSMPRPIASGGAALMNGRIHYFGGCEADRDTVTGDHWVLDLANQAAGWTSLAPMPVPRCHHSAAVLGSELWAIGGQLRHDTNPFDLRDVHAYDPVMDSWRVGPSLPEPRSHFEPATFVRNGNLYIAGGKDLTTNRTILADMLELDPVLGVWSYMPPLPNPRYGPGVQVIGDTLYAANGAALNNNPQTDLYSRDWNATFPDHLWINCGGPEVMSPTGTFCWCGDIGGLNGDTANFNPNADVLDTDEDEVFDKQLQARFSNGQPIDYRIPMGDGIFRVKFHLAERGTSGVGNRVLTLRIEGETVAEGLDLAADPGFQRAIERGFDVEVTDTALDIQIDTPSGQRALIAALEIERLPATHFELECSNDPNSTGAMAEMGLNGTSSVGTNMLQLRAEPIPTNQFGLFVQGMGAGAIMIANGGTLCISTPFYRLPPVQAQGNLLAYDLDLSMPLIPAMQINAGTTWRFQAWFRDPVVPRGYNLSNALRLEFTN